jgi:ferrous iron transport protein A
MGERLHELPLGRPGVVSSVDGDDAVKVRLLEMGLVPGTAVRVVKRAPGGDPLQLQLRGYHLSLRVSEASRVRLGGPEVPAGDEV